MIWSSLTLSFPFALSFMSRSLIAALTSLRVASFCFCPFLRADFISSFIEFLIFLGNIWLICYV